ncbi:SMP-30/gluconolactonase/LRE family protein [Nitrospinota bacterium]
MNWEFELIAGPYGSPLDGPVWDGTALLFTQRVFPPSTSDRNPAENRILRYDPQSGAVSDFRRWTNRTVGLAFSSEGVLYGCQSAGRRLVRFNADGSTEVLAHKLGGIYHNQPEKLIVDSRGRTWFTDPHGDLRETPVQIKDKLDHASILRMDSPPSHASLIRRMTYDTDAPAAVLLSKDEKTLYVSENSAEAEGKRELRAYAILEDGTLGPHTVLHTFGADRRGLHRGVSGMCLDAEGNIVACAGWDRSGPGPMVYVFSPEGRVLETHPVPASQPTNCAFGDASLSALYVTTSEGHLFCVPNTGRKG